jgi:DNA-binding MarR family transcriptional regulator
MSDVAKLSIAQSVKQTKPFSGPEEESCLTIFRTASELSHALEVLMKRHGITRAQYNVLRILKGAGPEGLHRNAIAERLVTPMPDVSRLLDRMQTAGWISREPGQRDRRQVATRITPKGAQLLTRLARPVEQFLRASFKGISTRDLEHLLTVLGKIWRNIS